jgi:hypothetical protein
VLGSVEELTRTRLAQFGRLDTVEAAVVLLVARRLDSGRWESGMGLSAVTKEHSRLLADALAGAEQVADPVDELRVRRDGKRRAG